MISRDSAMPDKVLKIQDSCIPLQKITDIGNLEHNKFKVYNPDTYSFTIKYMLGEDVLTAHICTDSQRHAYDLRQLAIKAWNNYRMGKLQ